MACEDPPPCTGDCCCDDDSCMGCCICDPEGEIGSPDDCNCTEGPDGLPIDLGDCKPWCRPQACQTCDGLGGCLNTCMSYRCESCDGSGNCKVCGDDPNLQCCGNGDCCPDNKICCPNPDSITQCCNSSCCNRWDCQKCENGNCKNCLWKPADYEELAACNKVDDPDTEPQPNGCSWSPENPAGCETTSFSEACNSHDTCYQTCGSSKGSCDTGFLNNLAAVCTGVPPGECRDDCIDWAAWYVWAVEEFGEGAYEDDQVMACACCDCT